MYRQPSVRRIGLQFASEARELIFSLLSLSKVSTNYLRVSQMLMSLIRCFLAPIFILTTCSLT